MKITKRQLKRIIKEEFQEDLLHQEWERDSWKGRHEKARRAQVPFPGALEDQMMEMLEEYIARLAESGEEGAVEVEALLSQLVSRAVDIAARDGVIR